MTKLPTEQLAERIRGKRRVLEQLHQVGQRQGELVASGDVETLLKLLAAKQRLLAGLQQVERDLEPFRDEDPEARKWQSPEHRAACAADAQACRTLLAAVMEMEKQHESAMVVRRDSVAKQLKQAHAAHDASGAYQSHRRPNASPGAPLATPSGQPAAGIDLTTQG